MKSHRHTAANWDTVRKDSKPHGRRAPRVPAPTASYTIAVPCRLLVPVGSAPSAEAAKRAALDALALWVRSGLALPPEGWALLLSGNGESRLPSNTSNLSVHDIAFTPNPKET